MISAKLSTRYTVRGVPITSYYAIPDFNEKESEVVEQIISHVMEQENPHYVLTVGSYDDIINSKD